MVLRPKIFTELSFLLNKLTTTLLAMLLCYDYLIAMYQSDLTLVANCCVLVIC